MIWKKNNDYPFNSEIKIHKEKFFVVDYLNTLKCYKLADGSECWNVKTEDAFTISNTKNSIIVGADINELSPIKGFNSYNFLVAKLAYKILSYKFLY